MTGFNYRKAGEWSGAPAKVRVAGQWTPVGEVVPPGEPGEGGAGLFAADDGFSDLDWWYTAEAADNVTVETVTNLNATGSGSLRAALDASESNSTTLIVFEVGGVLDPSVDHSMRSHGDNVYIAGQTAPSPGIHVIRAGLRIHGTNTIAQHMTFRPGDDVGSPNQTRGMTFDADAQNCILDHCSLSWAPDTVCDFHGTSGQTDRNSVVNSILAEGLYNSSHHEAPHSYGVLHHEHSTRSAVLGCYFAHCDRRHPFTRENTTQAWINNYIYNWGSRMYHSTFQSSTPEITYAYTVSDPGPITHSTQALTKRDAILYFEGTISTDSRDDHEDSPTILNEPDHWPSSIDEGTDVIDTGNDGVALRDAILPVVGARPADRDPHDQRVLDDCINRTGGFIDDETDVGGYPSYSTTTRSLNPPSTDLGAWLQHYTAEVETGESNPLH